MAPRKNYRGERLASNTGVCQSGEEWKSSPREDGRMKERGGRGREKFEKCTAPFFIIRLPSSISEGGKKECLRYRGIRDPRRASLQY